MASSVSSQDSAANDQDDSETEKQDEIGRLETNNSENNQTQQKVLPVEHPLMIKYQKNLKEHLQKLLQDTDEQLLELQKTVKGQEKENNRFAERGFELQKQLIQEEQRLAQIHKKWIKDVETKGILHINKKEVQEKLNSINDVWQSEIKKDAALQKTLEDVAFETMQLTSIRFDTLMDAESMKRATEKTSKDAQNLELQKLQQDILISRLENDRFNLEGKINLLRTQWGIKREEASDLRKELLAARSEMETIHFEKQQIVHQWKQSLVSFQKQDKVRSDVQESLTQLEKGNQTIHADISGLKKSLRKELERNEGLVSMRQFRDSDIARVTQALRDAEDREETLEGDSVVLHEALEISEMELQSLADAKIQIEKELESKERELQKSFNQQKKLEQKQMDMLHEKLTITKASKHMEKLINDTRNNMHITEEKGATKERDMQKLLLKANNLRSLMFHHRKELSALEGERGEHEAQLAKGEMIVAKNREVMDSKQKEVRELNTELDKMVKMAGGEELAPVERELQNIRKEITVSEQLQRDSEVEYLRFQNQLFSISKQTSAKAEENDFAYKKISVLEGKKIQIEADIEREDKDIKEIKSRIKEIVTEVGYVNKVVSERKEIQENLLQDSVLSKLDCNQAIKEREFEYIQKKNELKLLNRKKKRNIKKLIDLQRKMLYWEGKIKLADETRKTLRSDAHLGEFQELKNEVRRLQVRKEHLRKELEFLGQEMERAIYIHTKLYIEADKQVIFGTRKKSPEYVEKRILHCKRKIQKDKKGLENCNHEIEAVKSDISQLEVECRNVRLLSAELISKIQSLEHDIDSKEQEKRQSVIRLSLKQKKAKYMQKLLDGSYIKAVRNETRRPAEVQKLQEGLQAIKIIVEASINEYPFLEKTLHKTLDYISVAADV